MRAGKYSARSKAAGKKRMQAGKGKFARAVKAVLNKVAESKRYTLEASGTAISGTLNTWNITSGLTQGTNTSQRVGDKIHIKSLRLRTTVLNKSSGVTTSNQTLIRVIVFRGKYDYSVTNYPAGEVFEINAGSITSYNYQAPIDLNQVTPLYDKIHYLTPNFSGQVLTKLVEAQIRIGKDFTFREDDNFGKTSNLYVGVVCQTDGGGSAILLHDHTLSFTDV